MSRISVHAPHHPRKTPSVEGPLTWEGICALFEGCADFAVKEQTPPGWKEPIRICWLEGMVRTERLNDYVLRPLAACRVPEGVTPGDYLETGGVWDQAVRRQESLEETASALVSGSCALFLPGAVLTCAVETEEKRSVSQPDNETEVKGAKDSFVESIRTNTSLLRRRLRTPHLKIQRHIIGRQTQTPVELIWIDGIADPALPKRVAEKLADIDEDGVITTGELEEYLTEPRRTVFPRVLFTERPDRVCEPVFAGAPGPELSLAGGHSPAHAPVSQSHCHAAHARILYCCGHLSRGADPHPAGHLHYRQRAGCALSNRHGGHRSSDLL